jgi:hypothetical protein
VTKFLLFARSNRSLRRVSLAGGWSAVELSRACGGADFAAISAASASHEPKFLSAGLEILAKSEKQGIQIIESVHIDAFFDWACAKD